jgi:hypothetical protein
MTAAVSDETSRTNHLQIAGEGIGAAACSASSRFAEIRSFKDMPSEMILQTQISGPPRAYWAATHGVNRAGMGFDDVSTYE